MCIIFSKEHCVTNFKSYILRYQKKIYLLIKIIFCHSILDPDFLYRNWKLKKIRKIIRIVKIVLYIEKLGDLPRKYIPRLSRVPWKFLDDAICEIRVWSVRTREANSRKFVLSVCSLCFVENLFTVCKAIWSSQISSALSYHHLAIFRLELPNVLHCLYKLSCR